MKFDFLTPLSLPHYVVLAVCFILASFDMANRLNWSVDITGSQEVATVDTLLVPSPASEMLAMMDAWLVQPELERAKKLAEQKAVNEKQLPPKPVVLPPQQGIVDALRVGSFNYRLLGVFEDDVKQEIFAVIAKSASSGKQQPQETQRVEQGMVLGEYTIKKINLSGIALTSSDNRSVELMLFKDS